MAPDTPQSSQLREFSRALLLAVDSSQALRAWVVTSAPRCALVALLRAGDHQPCCAFGLERGEWDPTRLPPVPSAFSGNVAESRTLDRSRADAFEDLVFSLGFHEVAYLPLVPAEAGVLALARGEPSFAPDELSDLGENLDLLGRALAGIERRQPRPALRQGSPREVSELFGLTHALALAARPEAALEAGAGTLKTLLAPERGALVVSISSAEPPLALSWPVGEGAREAVERAARAARLSDPVEKRVASPRGSGEAAFAPCDWLVLGRPGEPVALALAWSGGTPDAARRVAQAVQASMALACDRFRVQKAREDGRLGSALRDLSLGILLLAPDGRVRIANPRARALLESLDSWPGEGEALDRVGAYEVDRGRVVEAARRGEALEILESQGGRTLVARFFAGPSTVADPRAQEGDIVIVLEDVTLERRQKKRLEQAERLIALATVMHGIAHDVAQPLSTISGYAQMLHRRPLPLEELKWVGMIREEAERCSRLLKNINQVVLDEAPEARAMDLGPLAEKVVQLAFPELRKQGIEAFINVDPETPAIRADSAAMTRVLLNLVNNAIQALAEHEGPRTIEVSVAPGECGSEALLAVADSGPGVPAEIRERLFDPYFTTREEGTGLGLSVVARRMQDVGGSIELDESHSPGARFCLRIPAIACAGEPSAASPEAGPEKSVRRAPASLAPLAEMRVLVAEDDEGFGGVLGEFLQAAGARAEVIRDGQTALERALASSPDVIVCDLNLPRLPGDALLARLRQSAPELVDRVIFATGEAAAGDRGSVGERFGRPCLVKPFELQSLLDHICRSEAPSGDAGTSPLHPLEGPRLTDH